MDSGYPHLTEIDGIDLSNYIRDPNSYNPVVYIHKRNLKRSNLINDEHKEKAPKMCHKGQQIDLENVYNDTYEVNVIKRDNHDPIMEHTIQFAKNLIPITIPPKANDENVYYTIKSAKKSKTEHNKSCKCNLNSDNKTKSETFDKDNIIKKRNKTTKAKLKRNFHHGTTSTTETISQSSRNTNNTIDDINNQSLSELSEMSEHVKLKEDASECKRERNKIVPSESFEAIADQYPDAGKIKVHIMNDKERNIFYENIRAPLVKAIKDSISQHCTQDVGKYMDFVEAKIDRHSSKLDTILERLSKIEKKLNKEMGDNRISLGNVQTMKASKLEELGEDISEPHAHHSSDGESQTSKRRRGNTDHGCMSIQDIERDDKELDRGEIYMKSYKVSSSHAGIKPTSSHRIPARFCWTDSK